MPRLLWKRVDVLLGLQKLNKGYGFIAGVLMAIDLKSDRSSVFSGLERNALSPTRQPMKMHDPSCLRNPDVQASFVISSPWIYPLAHHCIVQDLRKS